MEKRATFSFLRSFYEAACAIPDKAAQADFLLSICGYALDGAEPDVTGVAEAMFLLVKPNIDAARRKAASGAVGGSKQTASKAEANDKQSGSKQEANCKQTASKAEGKKEVGSRKKEVGSMSKEDGGDIPPAPPADQDRVQSATNVSMLRSEYEALLARFGEADTKRLVEILDNYKGSTGKRYKSDYRAILSWCVDKLEEKKAKEAKAGKNPVYYTGSQPPSEAENQRAREDMERMRRMMEQMKGGG